ncbi:MAG: DUF1015 domain-containing protein [Planctomycetaceae bacterium]|nr:DUF1015 domain-containing protein [Planctomycetaceae bacterium]
MPRIKPFRALRPVAEKAAVVASVPYDVVNREEASELAAGNPLSFLHVVRPDIDVPVDTDPYDDSVYATGAAAFQKLISDGILVQDEQPALFAYRQIMNGRSQVGIVCCCHIDDYEQNRILKHEKTRKAKEDDRTRHILALNAHPGPVFLTYRDVDLVNQQIAAVTLTEPLYDFVAADNIQHTVWRIDSTTDLSQTLSSVPVFYVADGHHRAASAWRSGCERRSHNPSHTGEEEYNWFLTVLFPASQLRILAYNRVIRDLNGMTGETLLQRLNEIGRLEVTPDPVPSSAGSFCVYLNGQWRRVTIPAETIPLADPIASLDVALLEERVLQPLFGIEDVRTDSRIDFVGGIRGTAELERLVDSGKWAVAFSMYPTSIEQLMAVSDAAAIMPPKSTWFEPKLRSGLLVHLMD